MGCENYLLKVSLFKRRLSIKLYINKYVDYISYFMCLVLNEVFVYYIWCESKKVLIGSILISKYEYNYSRLFICIFYFLL